MTMIAYGKRRRVLPAVLSREEVSQLLALVAGPLERLMFQTTYACGLRASEVLGLRVTDIDSSRMVLGVHHGKGGKDRQVCAVAGVAGGAAWPLATTAADDVAVPGSDADGPAFAGGVAARLPACRGGRRLHREGQSAYVAAQLRDPLAGSGCGPGDHSAVARAQRFADHGRYLHLTAPRLAGLPGLLEGLPAAPAPVSPVAASPPEAIAPMVPAPPLPPY